MKEVKSRQLSTPALAALACILGGLAGAAWIYGMTPSSGNGPEAQMRLAETAKAAENECPVRGETLAALKPLARGEVAAMAIQDTPRRLPALSFKDEDGASVTLADFTGKALLVNLWATWCAPCRAEMPALSKLQAQAGSEDFQVLAINIDAGDASKPEAFLSEIGVRNLPLYRDETMGVFNKLKKEGLAFGLPVTLLVGKDGCMLGLMNGPAEWAGADAKALIDALVAQSSSGQDT